MWQEEFETLDNSAKTIAILGDSSWSYIDGMGCG